MAKRRDLLKKGKSAGKSIAGTFKSVAGTVAEKGKQGGRRAKSLAGTLGSAGKQKIGAAATATRKGVKKQYNELTDDEVTDQEQARLQRARDEALTEARQEARQEFVEEFRENVADEAYDSELQRLRQQNQRQERTPVASPGFNNAMSMFGVPQIPKPQQRQQQSAATKSDTRQQRQQPAPAPAPDLSLFGVPPAAPSESGGSNGNGTTRERRDPLFGFRF